MKRKKVCVNLQPVRAYSKISENEHRISADVRSGTKKIHYKVDDTNAEDGVDEIY
uniref:Uncharacterized protein n=1 Tax=Myoviridae sp. ctk6V34 TaxID=2825164 RepID=A0A8S5V3P9_9CAUD|nr:MAG TPA: hypothetical protein [Myoviridae sp. ctk6V34]